MTSQSLNSPVPHRLSNSAIFWMSIPILRVILLRMSISFVFSFSVAQTFQNLATFFASCIMRVIKFSRVASIFAKFRTGFNLETFRTLFPFVISKCGSMVIVMAALCLQDYQIGNGIVAWVAVNMMDSFFRSERTPKMLFHNVSMFELSFAVNHYDEITTIVDIAAFPTRTFCLAGTNSSAKETTEPSRFCSSFGSKEFVFFITRFAGQYIRSFGCSVFDCFHNSKYRINGYYCQGSLLSQPS